MKLFSIEENLRVLNLNYNDVLLEHNYLSSSERLLNISRYILIMN